MSKLMKKFWADEQGLELSEYAVMAALIIVAIIAVIGLLGTTIEGAFQKLVNVISTGKAGG